MNSLIKSGAAFRSLSRVLSNSSTSRLISTSRLVGKEASVDADNPIKFSGSQAQMFKTKFARVGSSDPNEIPWFQPYVVVGSVAIFLIYFCILREENDIDNQLNKSLFDQVPGLEVSTLISLYKYNLENQIDNTDVIKRMLEIGVDPMKIE